jgi:hypothetical protein
MSKKSKKKIDVLLLPGASGWETWTGNGNGLALGVRSEAEQALDLESIPVGELTMAFPVRDVSALPFRTPTSDASLFPDMAEMHIERFGMRPPMEGGVLSDFFEAGRRGEDSLLVPVVLSPPPEGALPKRSPKSFDISARCLPIPANTVVIWRELGRWVFAMAGEDAPLHFQALASTDLDDDSGREIRISLSQLLIQGVLERGPAEFIVWLEEQQSPVSEAQLEAFSRGLGQPVEVRPKPDPFIPATPSKLLPADIRAERLTRRKRQQTRLLAAVAAVAYLSVIGWLGFRLYQVSSEARQADDAARGLGPEITSLQDHSDKWRELEPVVSTDHWPVEQLFRVAGCIPPNSGLRLKRAELSNQLEIGDSGGATLRRSVNLQGEAKELQEVNAFDLNLKRRAELNSYRWSTPAPSETKDGGWGFNFVGTFGN